MIKLNRIIRLIYEQLREGEVVNQCKAVMSKEEIDNIRRAALETEKRIEGKVLSKMASIGKFL